MNEVAKVFLHFRQDNCQLLYFKIQLRADDTNDSNNVP